MYLTESNLIEYLDIIYPNKTWVHNKQFLNYKFRPDYRNDVLKIAIEFDGYQHYTKANIINRDKEKDRIYKKEGYKVIRIPYFVQLDSEVINNLFNIEIELATKYPHGFIANNNTMILPADYCELGIKRFKEDLKRFYYIREDIVNSLRHKSIELGIENVLPPSLFDIEK
jgi:hypothetical protein